MRAGCIFLSPNSLSKHRTVILFCAGWVEEEKILGDLNGDALPDLALKLVQADTQANNESELGRSPRACYSMRDRSGLGKDYDPLQLVRVSQGISDVAVGEEAVRITSPLEPITHPRANARKFILNT